MNLVVISAAFSSANSNLYSTTRMLFSLSRSGLRARRGCRRSAQPACRCARVAVASGGMAMAILLAIYAPAQAFLALYGTAVAGMLFIWIVILFTYLRFRAALPPEQVARLPIRMPAHRVGGDLRDRVARWRSPLTTFFVDGLRYTVPSFLPFLAVMSLLYARMRKRARERTA